jgi:hypothetical protein
MAAERRPTIGLKDALFNQYQAILLAGTAGFALIAGSFLPFLLLAGAEFIFLPLVVGNQRLANALRMRSAAAQPPAALPEPVPLTAEGLDAESSQRFNEMNRLTAMIEKNYRRLSDESQSLLSTQRVKIEAILQTALSNLRALQAYSELAREWRGEKDPVAEIEALERRIADPATPDTVRERLRQTLEFKIRLRDVLRRSTESQEALRADLETLETALRILAQESIGLTAPAEVAARLDDIVKKAEETGLEIREFERWASDVGSYRLRQPSAH